MKSRALRKLQVNEDDPACGAGCPGVGRLALGGYQTSWDQDFLSLSYSASVFPLVINTYPLSLSV